MSDFTESVKAQVRDEWRTTSDIARSLPRAGNSTPYDHRVHVYKVLQGMARRDEAETRPCGGHRSEWRLAREGGA